MVGGWRLLVVGGSRQLPVGSQWRLAVDGWRLVVLGAVPNQKNEVLKDSPGPPTLPVNRNPATQDLGRSLVKKKTKREGSFLEDSPASQQLLIPGIRQSTLDGVGGDGRRPSEEHIPLT